MHKTCNTLGTVAQVGHVTGAVCEEFFDPYTPHSPMSHNLASFPSLSHLFREFQTLTPPYVTSPTNAMIPYKAGEEGSKVCYGITSAFFGGPLQQGSEWAKSRVHRENFA